MRTLVAIPVYNEEQYVNKVLSKVQGYAKDILVIDDGSNDQTPCLLAKQRVEVIRHAVNRGYGRSLRDAFRWAACYSYDWLVTMDCDEQHEPAALPDFYKAIEADDADIISGSRYLTYKGDPNEDIPPADRRAINARITEMVNERLGLHLTDAFCGFKAYRVSTLSKMRLNETGYAFPLQFWVQAAANDLRVKEIPVRLIYNDPNRTFGGPLNDADNRYRHYVEIFERELAKFPEKYAKQCCGCGAGNAPDAAAKEAKNDSPCAGGRG